MTDGPYVEAKEHLASVTIVDGVSEERRPDPARGRGRDVTQDAGVDALGRELAPPVLGAVVRRTVQFDAAEDAVQEALIVAAGQWPGQAARDTPPPGAEREVPDRDDTLTLLFLCCHLELSPPS